MLIKVKVLATQLSQSLCDPVDCSPPGSSVHGILQARVPERVAMPSSRGSSWPRDQTQVSYTGRGILYSSAAREALISYSLLILPIAIEVPWERELSPLGVCLHLPGPLPQMSSLLDGWGGGGDQSHLPPTSTKQNLALPIPQPGCLPSSPFPE